MIAVDVFADALRQCLAPVACHLDDARVSEVLINGPFDVYVERAGRLERVRERFASADALMAAITVIAQYAGRFVDAQRPVLEARLPDGSRVQAVLSPAARTGPYVAIRRFVGAVVTVEMLVASGALSQDAAAALKLLVMHKQNVLVAGGTGSGKTSLLNALASFIADDERVVVIEDASELRLQGEHVVALEAQKPDARGRGGVSMGELFRATLRIRPDRIVLGEIRGGEALDLVQAMTSGHGGCMSTIHATYPQDTLRRLETLALLAAPSMPLSALRAQIASGVNVVVQVERDHRGARHVTHIVEVALDENARGQADYQLTTLFERQPTQAGTMSTALVASGQTPRCAPLVHRHGARFPEAMYAREAQV